MLEQNTLKHRNYNTEHTQKQGNIEHRILKVYNEET